MPSSASESIPYIIEFARKNKPNLTSVLDVGVGFGKGAFLFREYFDAKTFHRFKPEDWQLKIVGVEIYEDYLSQVQKLIYDEIIIGDIFNVMPKLGKFDLAILSDIIEHFPKEKGHELLQKLFEHVDDIVIATPNGLLSKDLEEDNEHEKHKSGWEIKDFGNYNVIDKAIIPRIRKKEEVLVVYLRK